MATDDNLLLLSEGELNVTGRLVDASNATLYATVTLEDQSLICIYKPIAGAPTMGFRRRVFGPPRICRIPGE